MNQIIKKKKDELPPLNHVRSKIVEFIYVWKSVSSLLNYSKTIQYYI